MNMYTYHAGWFGPDKPTKMFNSLWNELDWVRHDKVPRREYYANDVKEPYTYGRGAGVRTYQVQPWHPTLEFIREEVQKLTRTKYETCFLNGYENSRDHLGWHADDSPEMDDDRPIVIVSLGAEREIWFRPNASMVERQIKIAVDAEDKLDEGPLEPSIVNLWRFTLSQPDKLLLEHGSICIMHAGMQDTHEHRIPKCDREVGPRISLTFRGYKHV